jgi:tetratricopeptide (TPR) repeat protein
VLVTTRRRDAVLADRGTVIDIDLFTLNEALAYLTGRLDPDGRHPDRLAEAGELAEDLGRLPLALAHATAYILDQQPLSCADYRKLLAQQRLETALPATAGDDYAARVTAIWALSVTVADQLPPTGLARPLLMLAAVLDPHGIPTGLFTTEAAHTDLAVARTPTSAAPAVGYPETAQPVDIMSLGPRRGGLLRRLLRRPPTPVLSSSDLATPVAAEDVDAGLRNLHRHSLLALTWDQEEAGTGSVRVHALVQRAIREQARPPNLDAAARTAADALLEAWPEEDYTPAHALLAQSLRDNTDALAATAPNSLWTTDAHPVLFRAGRSRSASGLFGQAVAYWTTLVATAEQVLGPDHPDTRTCRSNLGLAYQDAGCPAKALALSKRALADAERLLGPSNPESLTIQSVLALACQDAGRPAEALALLKRALADAERLLRPDAPESLDIRDNLAVAYQATWPRRRPRGRGRHRRLRARLPRGCDRSRRPRRRPGAAGQGRSRGGYPGAGSAPPRTAPVAPTR